MAAHRGDPALDDPWYGVRDDPVKAPAPARSASGAEETRTPDPLLAKEVLYQLSYGPKNGCAALGAGSQGDYRSRGNACGRFWTRTRGLCLIRAVL